MRPFVALFCLFLRHTFWKVLLLLAALGGGGVGHLPLPTLSPYGEHPGGRL